MEIPKKYIRRYAYHFTHLDNLETIVKYGLLSHNEKVRLKLEHNDIALSSIQDRRSRKVVPCGSGGHVHDYVPLYFCSLSPMLLSIINRKVADEQLIVYLAFPITIINDYPYVFTDAAANTEIPPNYYTDPADLDKLNWEAIDSLKWKMPTDAIKQARMAELLIHKKVPLSSMSHFVVWNKAIREEIEEKFENNGLQTPSIRHDNGKHYYENFWDGGGYPPVTGPVFTKYKHDEIIEKILPNIGLNPTARFEGTTELRDALRVDINVLPETKDINGLIPENIMHKKDVGTHTIAVVDNLLKSPEYKKLKRPDKIIVELAAFLHDIGKGPKSRWKDNGGKQKVDPDHPIKSLVMLERILTQELKDITEDNAKLICKLVCYHDLVGDIVGKGRRVQELLDVVDSERELDMLIALSKADMDAIEPAWVFMYESEIDELRNKVITTISTA